MPDEYDRVQLVPGEWLRSEIRAMYQDSMEFDSEELDLLSLDLEDVRVVRSARQLAVRVSGDRVATGRLLVEGEDVRVLGEEGQQRFTRHELLTITRAAQPAPWSSTWSVRSSSTSRWSGTGSRARSRTPTAACRRRTTFG